MQWRPAVLAPGVSLMLLGSSPSKPLVVSAWFGTPTALAQTRAGGVKWPRFAVPTTRLLAEQVRGVPAVRIGPSPTQEYTLWHGIAGAVRMPDGTLAVFDAGNFRMVLFDGQGRFLRAAGREGDAPGIHAWLTFLHPSGAVDTTIALPAGHQLRSTALVLPHRPPPDAAQPAGADAGGGAAAPHGANPPGRGR